MYLSLRSLQIPPKSHVTPCEDATCMMSSVPLSEDACATASSNSTNESPRSSKGPNDSVFSDPFSSDNTVYNVIL